MAFQLDRSMIMKLLLLAAAAYAVWYVVSVYSKSSAPVKMEKFEACPEGQEWDETTMTCKPKASAQEGPSQPPEASTEQFEDYNVQPAQAFGSNEVFHTLDSAEDAGQYKLKASASYPKDCFPNNQLKPEELLPGDSNSKWAQSVPQGQGSLDNVNMLNASYHIGVNTVGQTLRNANRQLRSEPLIERRNVSPWGVSTIEPDINRSKFEIGTSC